MQKMKFKPLFLAALVGMPFVFSAPAAEVTDTNRDTDIESLKQQVQALNRKVQALEQQRALDPQTNAEAAQWQIQNLDQKVRILGRQRELDQESAAAAAKAQPRLTIGANGVNFVSADTNFSFGLHGLLQVDNHSVIDNGNSQGNDTFILRRARPIFSGTVYRDFDFNFVPDFGGNSVQIYDAYMNYRYQPWVQLRAGKFKPPLGLEQLQSDPVTSFSERSLVAGLAPSRDLGFQLWGDISRGRLSYAAGVFNGAGDARNAGNTDFENHREFAGRLFVQPFKESEAAFLKGFGFGVGGSWGNMSSNSTGLPSTTGGTLPGYYTEGQQQFFAYTNTTVANGEHWRILPQASYYYGPLGLMGEYAISEQRVSRTTAPFPSADIHNTAWSVNVGWVLTGEKASYTGVVPNHPFDPKAGQWGAFQVVGRYSEMDIDNAAFPLYANPAVAATAAQAWTVGLNWYLSKNIRVNTSYTRTTFTGGGSAAATTPPGNVTHQPEQMFISRLQLVF
jgi:phosphate-selective porin OprO and OprP